VNYLPLQSAKTLSAELENRRTSCNAQSFQNVTYCTAQQTQTLIFHAAFVHITHG